MAVPKLVGVQATMNGRFMAHRDINYDTNPYVWKTGPAEFIGQPVDVYGAGGMGIIVFDFDTVASGKIVSVSVEDSEGVCHFSSSKAIVRKNERQAVAILMIPSCKTEHQITVKGLNNGVTVSKVITVFP